MDIDVNATDWWGTTALDEAYSKREMEMAKVLE